ncbi:MAG: polysaccharide biosynthesis/export family protein [Candidatus Muiribacteriota bacterium]
MFIKKNIMLFFIILTIILSHGETVILIEPGDLIEIKATNLEEYSFLKRVDNRGFLNLPYIGEVKAEGLSTARLAQIIKNRLEDGYFRNPEIIVEIKKSALKSVFIFGLIRNAGEYEYNNGLRMLELLSKAGGYVGDVRGLKAKVFRNNKKIGLFKLSNLVIHNEIKYNIEILPDDVVIIISEGEHEN